jgi:hypothetical protein
MARGRGRGHHGRGRGGRGWWRGRGGRGGYYYRGGRGGYGSGCHGVVRSGVWVKICHESGTSRWVD